MRTRFQSRSISSAMRSGMAVNTPLPISHAGAYTVTMLSVPTRAQPFGAKAADWPNACFAFSTLPNTMATLAAPLEIRKARREMPWKAIPSNPGAMAPPLCLLHFVRRALDGGDDLVVGAATADVAVHVGDDLLARRLFVLGEQRRRGHDLPGLAVAALRHLLGDPCLLQRMLGRRRKAFDRGDLLPGDRGDRRDARARRIA